MIKLSNESNVDSLDAIVITESLASDEVTLIPIFEQIQNIFGYFPKDSIIIVGTKRNECS